MKVISAVVEVHVHKQLLYDYVKESVCDSRWLETYSSLRAPTQYSGRIVEDVPSSRLTIDESNIDSATGRRGKLGWRIRYSFDEASNGKTMVNIKVEYGFLLGFLGLTTIEQQAKNEILSRAHALLALEHGFKSRKASDK